MKKKLLTTLFAISFFISGTFSANAIYCSNCTNIGQWIVDHGTQIAQLGKEAITSGATLTTSVNTTLMQVDQLILKPMRDAMTLISIMQSGKNIQNLISGSLGTDKLLVDNPLQLFNDTMTEVKLGALGELAASGGPFSDSIMGAIFEDAKFESLDLGSKLAEINTSNVPAMMSAKICDNDAFLTSLVTDGGAQTADEIAAKKTEIYTFACNASPTDKEQAEKLIALNEQNPQILNSSDNNSPTIGDGLYDLTVRGNNQYTKATLSVVQTDLAAKKKEEQVKADVNVVGGGIKSLTECTKRAPTLPGMNPDQAPCLETSVIQTSSILNDQFKDALGAPLQTLISSFGTGAGGLIGTAFNAISLFQGISNSIGSLTGGSSGGSGGSATGLAATFNNPLVVRVNQTPVPDLATNPQAKATLTQTPSQQLDNHLSVLSTLATTDQSFLAAISGYQGQINGMKGCFVSIGNDFEGATTSPRYVAAVNYANSLTNNNNTLVAKINNEISLIGTTRTLIADTRTKITNSQSTQEILDAFNAYNDTVKNQGLPSMTSGGSRDAELISFKSEAEQNLMEGGNIPWYNTDCTSLRAEFQAAVNNGTNNVGTPSTNGGNN
jgi:hypothetical protein